jgi:hypothetical protein
VYGNDEINFESFGCSMPSLTRGDFHGYHSSEDNINNILFDKVNEAISLVVDVIKDYQNQCIIEKKFNGLVSLANPKFDLYIDPGQLAFGIKGENKELRIIMDALPAVGKYTSLEKLIKGLNVSNVNLIIQYLRLWEEKGLIKLHGIYDELLADG